MARKPLPTYLKLSTEFYDLEQHPNGEQAMSFYIHHARQADGPILEPMCGSGRFLIPILQAGLDAEGFDASPICLTHFNRNMPVLVRKKPGLATICTRLERDKRYRLIFIPYGLLGLDSQILQKQKGLANTVQPPTTWCKTHY